MALHLAGADRARESRSARHGRTIGAESVEASTRERNHVRCRRGHQRDRYVAGIEQVAHAPPSPVDAGEELAANLHCRDVAAQADQREQVVVAVGERHGTRTPRARRPRPLPLPRGHGRPQRYGLRRDSPQSGQLMYSVMGAGHSGFPQNQMEADAPPYVKPQEPQQ